MKDENMAMGWLGPFASATDGVVAKQWFFTGFVGVMSLLLAVSGSWLVFSTEYVGSVAALIALSVVTSCVPWGRVPGWCFGAVPVLDIAMAGVMRDVFRVEASAVALFAFLPALWLAYAFRHVGNLLGTVAVTLAISLPTVLRALPEVDSVIITRSLLVPLVVAQIGFMVALARCHTLDERSRAQAALRQKEALLLTAVTQERLLENIIDTIDMGILVLDREGRITRMNRAQKEFCQFASPPGVTCPQEKDLMLRFPNTKITVPDRQRPIARAADHETFSNYVVGVGPTSGKGRKISTSARQIIDVDGQHDGAVVVFADVTPYFDAARRQQRFIAAVSHELRTPLTSILGYLDLVLDAGQVSDTDAAHLEVVSRNAEQLLSIVQDLLATQSVQDSGIHVVRSTGDMSELTRQAIESISQEAAAKHLNVAVFIDDTPEVAVDASRMTQAITNLLSNAVKYTPERGGVTISVRAVHQQVEVSVSDTGIGMSAEEQTNLFTQYYRTDTARQQHIPGHGLGLSITKVIVLAHEGQISVRSTEGAGSTFTIRIPQHQRNLAS